MSYEKYESVPQMCKDLFEECYMSGLVYGFKVGIIVCFMIVMLWMLWDKLWSKILRGKKEKKDE